MAQKKDFATMTAEEKVAAYDKLIANRQARQAGGKARRAAVKALIAAHKPEYEKLLAKAQAEG